MLKKEIEKCTIAYIPKSSASLSLIDDGGGIKAG